MAEARIALVLTLVVLSDTALSPCRGGEPARSEAVQYLKLLEDENPLVRKRALIVLERMGAEARPALPVLTRLLKAADPAVRAWAATNLAQMGAEARPALDALVSSLNDADGIARGAKAEALDTIEEHVRLAELLARVRNPKLGKAERGAACKDVVTFFPHLPSVRPALEAALLDPVVKVSAAAGLDALDTALAASPQPQALFTLDHKGQVFALTFSPFGKRLFTGGEERVLKVWDAVTGKLLMEMKGHTHSIHDLAVSPDGRRVASAGLDGTVRVWNVLSGKELVTIKGDFEAVRTVAFNGDGTRVALGAEVKEKSNRIQVHDATTGAKLLSLESQSYYIRKVAFSPSGSHVAAVFNFRGEPSRPELRVWDASNGKLLYSREGNDGPATVIYPPDGRHIILGTTAVAVLNAADGKVLGALNTKHKEIAGVALSPDGRLLAYTTNGGRYDDGKTGVAVGRADTGAEVLFLPGHGGYLHLVAMSRDGGLLAVSSNDFPSSQVKVWDLSTLTRRPFPSIKESNPVPKK